jgi:hypothetical protein
MKKPAGFPRRLNTWRSLVWKSLNLLAPTVVIVTIKVKIIVRKR